MNKGEVIFFSICVGFFAFMLYAGLDLAGLGRVGEMGSGFWPLTALAVSALLSVVLLLESVRKFRRQTAPGPDQNPEEAAELRRQRLTVTLSVVCFLAYLVAIPWIGFILGTLFFVLGFALALGERRKVVLIVSPFLVTAMIVWVFARFITIPFPKGIGPFAAFSRLFY